MRFLFRWQHASPGWQTKGEGGLVEVIEQLQGFEAAAGAWEPEILPLRVREYKAGMLDDLCLSGEVAWGKFSRQASEGNGWKNRTPLSRPSPISLGLREALPWLLDGPWDGLDQMAGAPNEVLRFLSEHGASFLQDFIGETRRLPSDVESALWQLAAAGLVTTDRFAVLRSLVDGTTQRVRRSARSRRRPRRRPSYTRWSLLRTSSQAEEVAESRAMQFLRRYGVVFPELLAREPGAPRWRDLLRVYRRAEARGEIRGGRFVAGFVGEQFALPEAVDALRTVRKAEPDGRLTALSACDPLNLAGITTPGPRVPALLGNRLVVRDGLPVASLQGGQPQFHADLDDPSRAEALGLLAQPTASHLARRRVAS